MSSSSVRRLQEADVPMICAPVSTFTAMQKISKHTAKIRIEDTEKVNRAITLVESYVDLDQLLQRAGHLQPARYSPPKRHLQPGQ